MIRQIKQLKRRVIRNGDGETTRVLVLIRDTFLLREDYYIVEEVINSGRKRSEKIFDLKRGTINKKIEEEIEAMFHIQTNKKNERLFSYEQASIMFDIIIRDI